MKIDIREEPGLRMVSLVGRIDALSSPELEKKLKNLLDVKRLILDFRRVDFISSAGLRVMLIIAGQMKKEGGELILFGLNRSVLEIFIISGFNTIIRTFETYEDAIKI